MPRVVLLLYLAGGAYVHTPLWHLGDVKGGPLRPAGLPNSKFNPLRAFFS
jgi:hypothetical protein